MKRYLLSVSLFLLGGNLAAQNITGTWEGDLGDDEFLQVNVIQNGNKLCGYTWDYVKRDRRSYCVAYFEGRYYPKQEEWILNGTSFVENSGSHVLMRIKLTNSFVDGRIRLEGIEFPRSVMIGMFNLGAPDSIHLMKMSSRPREILDNMRDCFLEQKRSKDTIVRFAPAKPTNPGIKKDPQVKPADPVVKTVPPLKPADSLIKKDPPVKPPDPIVKKDPQLIKPVDSLNNSNALIKRKNKEQGHIDINVKNITLNVYDNAVVDNDSVSIFYNGRLLLSHQRLSEKPIVINLQLDEKQTRHEIVLFAENLGGIPPNTALVVIYAGDKRYELFSSASLEENAVIVFDYKPK